jgi:hypothetical protein
LVAVLASGGLALFAPIDAGPAVHENLPTIKYTIGGVRGTNGWYRGSRGGNYVVLRWTVRDPGAEILATSGCRKSIIKGPTSGTKRTCVAASDNGVNSVTTRLIKVDGDPPRLGAIAVRGTRRFVSLRWKASRDAHFRLTRSPGKRGVSESVFYEGVRRQFIDHSVTTGVSYRYTLLAIDRAGNSAAKTIRATARAALLRPLPGIGLRSPHAILFAWDSAPQASYYNLQLWFKGHRIFSAWPSVARFRLVAPWTYGGVKRYLRIGSYRWYVWPGRGPRTLGTYGSLLGSSTFLVTR